MELDVIAFAAHPDDAELAMGGTLAKLSSEGKRVGVIDLSRGELSSRGTVESRKLEWEKASEILGLAHRENLMLPDGKLRPCREYVEAVVSKMRQYKPKIIFSPYKVDRHPDHVGVSQIVKEAHFFSGVWKFETRLNGELQDPFRPAKHFYFMTSYFFEPGFIMDISNFMKEKMESVRAYSSQFYNPESDEPETYISKKSFVGYLESRAQTFGFLIGKEYGEGFYSEESIELDLNGILSS